MKETTKDLWIRLNLIAQCMYGAFGFVNLDEDEMQMTLELALDDEEYTKWLETSDEN